MARTSLLRPAARTVLGQPAGAGDPRPRLFGPASEEPYRRRSSDWIRLAVAAVLLGLLAARAPRVGPLERNIYQLFDSLPRGLVPFFRGLGGVGALWAVGLVVSAAVLGHRWRLARDLLIAGVLAWGVARVLGSEVIGHVGLRASLRTLSHLGHTPAFPYVRVSIIVAVAATAGPYVGRPVRRLGQALVVTVSLSAMYVGLAFPEDVLGGVVLGWGLAAAVHLIFGSPGGRPSSWQLERTLSQIGIVATDVGLVAEQDSDATIFTCDSPAGSLWVKAIGRDEVDAQLMAKAWRHVVYKQPPPPLHLSRVQQVEHEACMTLLAGSAGVGVADVLFVGRAGPGAALLVMRSLPGRRLVELEPPEVTDTLLTEVWAQVARLRSARIAHGALDTAHIVIVGAGDGEQRAAVVAFGRASTTGFELRGAQDVAELLASSAGIVGDGRAVAAAVDALGPEVIADALPFLQPAALRRATRTVLGSRRRDLRQRLDSLRGTAGAAAAVEATDLPTLQRFKPTSILLAVSSLVAIVALLDQVGDPSHVWATLHRAEWGWLAAALAASLLTNIAYAVALMGTLPLRLPLWPTSELELAMSYSNLVIPVVGGAGFQIRFLQRQGAALTEAVTAGGLLSTLGTVVTQVPLFALALLLSPSSLALGSISVTGVLRYLVAGLLVLGLIAAIAFGVPRLRRLVLRPARVAAGTMWAAARSPRQLALILGGNLVVAVLGALCLLFCLLAFGSSLSFWTVLAASIGVSTIAALVPIPGGGATVGSLGLAGTLAALGIPTEVAVTATLANGMAVSYLPAVPGWFATRHLLGSDYL